MKDYRKPGREETESRFDPNINKSTLKFLLEDNANAIQGLNYMDWTIDACRSILRNAIQSLPDDYDDENHIKSLIETLNMLELQQNWNNYIISSTLNLTANLTLIQRDGDIKRLHTNFKDLKADFRKAPLFSKVEFGDVPLQMEVKRNKLEKTAVNDTIQRLEKELTELSAKAKAEKKEKFYGSRRGRGRGKPKGKGSFRSKTTTKDPTPPPPPQSSTKGTSRGGYYRGGRGRGGRRK